MIIKNTVKNLLQFPLIGWDKWHYRKPSISPIDSIEQCEYDHQLKYDSLKGNVVRFYDKDNKDYISFYFNKIYNYKWERRSFQVWLKLLKLVFLFKVRISYLKSETTGQNILIILNKILVKWVHYVIQDRETLKPSSNLASSQPLSGLPQAFSKFLLEDTYIRVLVSF